MCKLKKKRHCILCKYGIWSRVVFDIDTFFYITSIVELLIDRLEFSVQVQSFIYSRYMYKYYNVIYIITQPWCRVRSTTRIRTWAIIIPALHQRHAWGNKIYRPDFADDTISYLTISSDKISNDLQNDLDKLALWETKWKMSFHPDKCNVPTISRKNNMIPTSYKLHGHTLKTEKVLNT